MSEAASPQAKIRPPSTLDAAAPILLLILLVVLAQVLYDGDATAGPFQIALIVCALFAGMIARKNGHRLQDVGKHAVEGISSAAYLPYCFFNLVNPILSFVFDALGFQIVHISDEEAAAAYAPAPEQLEYYGVGGYSSDPGSGAAQG